jgi:two-component system, NtrC family, response regulator AtoC
VNGANFPTPTSAMPAAAKSSSAANGLRVLAVATEEESGVFDEVRSALQGMVAEFETAPDLPRATRRLASGSWDLVFVVVSQPDPDSFSWWIEALRGVEGSPRLVAFSRRGSLDLILQAERLGLLDVLPLPPSPGEIVKLIARVRAQANDHGVPLPPVDAVTAGPYALVGQSPAMLDVYKMVAHVVRSTATVLLLGESGTGKEIIARAIHATGARSTAPFVAVNCAAIPENLLESELFGHEKGSFTGAVARKTGRFELAAGGTLFLDEIADMSLALQAKILRAVQEREIERVGGKDVIPVDIRLIAATNRNLQEAIAQGKFREDLYYRLAIVTINLPLLADRGDDVLLLTSYFAREYAARYGKPISRISEPAIALLRQHRWVGNVRELRNVVERAVIVATDDTLRVEHFPEELRASPAPAALAVEREDAPPATLADLERRHIQRVLAQTGGAISAAATILGIHRNTLARKVREHGL